MISFFWRQARDDVGNAGTESLSLEERERRIDAREREFARRESMLVQQQEHVFAVLKVQRGMV